MPPGRTRTRNLRSAAPRHHGASSGQISGRFELDKVTSDIEEAIDGIGHTLVVTPAYAHAAYANLLKGKLEGDQVIVVYPAAFAVRLFGKVFAEEGRINAIPRDNFAEA